MDALVIGGRRAMRDLGWEGTLGVPTKTRRISDGWRPW
jgi:hypothetical protein